MRRLPNVSAVVSQVFDRVDAIRQTETEKVATEAAPTFTIPLAEEMHKLAAVLRDSNPDRVTYADVHKFAGHLLEQA